MTTTIRNQLEGGEKAPSLSLGPSRRDVQRDALRDLVALATECAATEARIEELHRTSNETAAKELEKTKWAQTNRFAALVETAKKNFQDRLAQIEAQRQAKLAEAVHGHEQARRKIDREHEPIEQKTQKQLDHAIWLADSVLEVAQNQIAEETKRAHDAIKEHLEALTEMEATGLRLLSKYKAPAPIPDASEPALPTGKAAEDLAAEMINVRERAQGRLQHLKSVFLPGLFVGWWPWVCLIFLCVVAGGAAQFIKGLDAPHPKEIAIAAGAMLVVAVVLGFLLRAMGHKQLHAAFKPLQQSAALERVLGREQTHRVAKRKQAREAEATRLRDSEVHRIKQKAAPVFAALKQKRAAAVAAADAQKKANLQAVQVASDQARRTAEAQHAAELNSLADKQTAELNDVTGKFNSETHGSGQAYSQSRSELERRLRDGLADIQGPMGDNAAGNGQPPVDWSDPSWRTWTTPKKFPALVRFGEMKVDLRRIAHGGKENGDLRLALPPTFDVPAPLAFPRGASVLIQHDRAGREQALKLMQTVMARLLTSLPAGRARFTIIDPIGLGQNFAGFMRLADYDEALVGTRIWTETDQIEQRLADMTEHMETVIQKYLRNEFATIDDYNAQAGELAEPYRFLVVADYPTSFQGDAFRRLASIASTGARCGVYVLMARDIRVPLPSEAQIEDLEAHSVNIVQEGDRFIWKDAVFGQFPLTLDAPPPEAVLSQLLDKVGQGAKDSKRVEVNFDTIAPHEREFWTGSTTEEIQVPIGRMGATRLQLMRLGKGVAQHVLIAGKTGSGKSSLLHALVTNLAMWYSPDQIELYLIDFKKGVEFKVYATQNLPHARAIAVESDREFGVSVLNRLDAELVRRGELFRKVGVQDLAAYRKTANAQIMPRTLLIIDEFQEFFTEDDKLGQDAGLLMDRLVRQGRAFGIHVLLGSQSIGGSGGLARTTLGQMAVRIALQTSEADSQLILGDNNSAARLLSRPGEAIYNDGGGLVEANSPFQVAWLPDAKREKYLEKVSKLADAHGSRLRHAEALVFEGNAPADVLKNQMLTARLKGPAPTTIPAAGYAWMGEPVGIKDPAAVIYRRQSGSNAILIGQQEEQATTVMLSGMISLATQYPANGAIFHVMDGTPADSSLFGSFERMKSIMPQEVRMIDWRAVPDVIDQIAQEMATRQAGDPAGLPEIYIVIYGLQRYRILRKAEEEFSFSSSGDEPKKANTGKQFADILREGPALGIHVIAWSDTYASLERTLDRTALREFDNRILFQMSANDSSSLIDSPAANKLGFFRALSYSEEQGVTEKFRPYALPSKEWLDQIAAALAPRALPPAVPTA